MGKINNKDPQMLINELALLFYDHSIPPDFANDLLTLLRKYHPQVPKSISKLFVISNVKFPVESLPITYVDVNAPPPVEAAVQQEEEKTNISDDKKLEAKLEEIRSEMKNEFVKLTEVVKNANVCNNCVPTTVDETITKPMETDKNELTSLEKKTPKCSIRTRLPIKNENDLLFIEQRIEEDIEVDMNDLWSYFDFLTVKCTGILQFVSVLVEQVFWEGFLQNLQDLHELLETKIVNEIVSYIRENFNLYSKVKIIDLLKQKLGIHAPETKKIETMPQITENEDTPNDNEIEEKMLYEEDASNVDEDTIFIYLDNQQEENLNQDLVEDKHDEPKNVKIEQKSKPKVIQKYTFNLLTNPIGSRDELNHFEQYLRQKESVKSFQYFLNTFIAKEATYSRYLTAMFKGVFSSDFLKYCRWSMDEGSLTGLKKTISCRLMINKVKHEFPNVPDRMIINRLSQFLRSEGFKLTQEKKKNFDL